MNLRRASLIVFLGTAVAHGQEPVHSVHLQHRVFANWGYNRAQFSASNIHFTGPGYDFILHDVESRDRPEAFTIRGYFGPKNIWIPQYNYRVGWFLNEHWSFSLGLDHMKYIVRQDQEVRITGRISADRSSTYAGQEEHMVRLTEDLLCYEHTDGLNLLSVDADHYGLIKMGTSGHHAVFLTTGAFVGPVIPRTDVRLFGDGINNRFHLAGYGAGGQVGLFAVLADRLYLRALVKGGYIELPSVLTTGSADERAEQRFWFIQEQVVAGVLIGR